MADLIRVDPDARRAWQGDHPLTLPRVRFDLLATLVRHAGRALTRKELSSEVWGTDLMGRTSVAMQVSLLRAALGDPAAAPVYITTVPGCGYRFEANMVAFDDDEISRLRRDLAQARTLHTRLTAGLGSAADIIRAALTAGQQHGAETGLRVLRERAGDVPDLLAVLSQPSRTETNRV